MRCPENLKETSDAKCVFVGIKGAGRALQKRLIVPRFWQGQRGRN